MVLVIHVHPEVTHIIQIVAPVIIMIGQDIGKSIQGIIANLHDIEMSHPDVKILIIIDPLMRRGIPLQERITILKDTIISLYNISCFFTKQFYNENC